MRLMRLKTGDRELAREVFALMAGVFEEQHAPLSDGHLDRLLAREEFWVLAALEGKQLVGGLTAHTLPMTRTEALEVFLYDIAVRGDHQRQGVGRSLVNELRALAAASHIQTVFVAADDEDAHALDFYRALGGIATRATFFTFESAND